MVFQHVVGVVFEGAVTAGPTTVVFFDDAKEPPRGSHDRQPRQLVTATHTTRPPGVNTAVNIRACRSQRETLWSHPLLAAERHHPLTARTWAAALSPRLSHPGMPQASTLISCSRSRGALAQGGQLVAERHQRLAGRCRGRRSRCRCCRCPHHGRPIRRGRCYARRVPRRGGSVRRCAR